MTDPVAGYATPLNQASAKAGSTAYAQRRREPVEVDFDAAIARLKIILAEVYSDGE
ncbi:hypothetical protein VT930_11935 [Mycobacterium sherrisii]|uniref:hypothetical protein n=1 Tax=Mycobacterium sherrisii TaxID=243061 RepID=UPI002DDD41FE|nr:hypothetical protein [Mycobacterium sherrisii]MEC4763814.1 hypothetical protein [Mycobacterium sherrisii]